jgi:two-component system, LytTR family, response regulator
MIKCIVIDDEQSAIDVLTNYINQVSFLQLEATSLNPLDALEVIYTQKVDLIFLDIQMPELSGIDFMKVIKGRCKVILTTAYKQYALEGYEHSVSDYLLKPISFERFLQATQKVQEQIDLEKNASDNNIQEGKNKSLSEDFMFVKTDNRMQKINYSDMLFVEGLGNYVNIKTTKGKFTTLLNIKDLVENLPSEQFLRVHRSYIVSLEKIEYVEGNNICLQGNITIPLSETYRNQLWTALDEKVIGGKK